MAQLKSLIVSGATRLIGKMFAQDIQAESVVVAADPTQNLQVATKQYVDKAIISGGGEVNQNAFSNVKVGSTTVAADTKTDTLELVAGTNVTLTPDATNDKVTIAATDTKYTASTTSIGSANVGTAISADDITAWTTNTPTVVTKKTVVTGGTTTSITPVTSKTVVTAASGATAVYSAGVLTLTNGNFSTGASVTTGTAVQAYTSLTTGDSVSVTAGKAASLSYTSKSIPNISVASQTVVTGITAN